MLYREFKESISNRHSLKKVQNLLQGREKNYRINVYKEVVEIQAKKFLAMDI